MSGWKMWEDAGLTKHMKIELSDRDAWKMHRVQMMMLDDAMSLIETVFDPDTPRLISELEKKMSGGDDGPRRVSDMSAIELRKLLGRMGASV